MERVLSYIEAEIERCLSEIKKAPTTAVEMYWHGRLDGFVNTHNAIRASQLMPSRLNKWEESEVE